MPEMTNGYDFDLTKSDSVVLCGASSYVQKYYFNEKFKRLPDEIKDSVFLNLTDMGFEKNIKEYLEKIKKES